MRLLSLVSLSLLALAGCDSADPAVPDEASLAGDYVLVRYDGAPLPSGGVASGDLALRIDETIPVFEAAWTRNGARVQRSGLYSVSGSAVEFTETSGAALTTYAGTAEGDRITVRFDGAASASFTFERE